MMTDLMAVAAELADRARNETSGRAARSVLHGDRLRAVLVALAEGGALADHTAPGPACLQVLAGELELRCGGEALVLAAGELTPVPEGVHSVHARGQCAFLLTISLPG